MSLVGKAMVVAAATALVCLGSAERHRVEAKAALKHEPLRCRMYFGCTPVIDKQDGSFSSEVQ